MSLAAKLSGRGIFVAWQNEYNIVLFTNIIATAVSRFSIMYKVKTNFLCSKHCSCFYEWFKKNTCKRLHLKVQMFLLFFFFNQRYPQQIQLGAQPVPLDLVWTTLYQCSSSVERNSWRTAPRCTPSPSSSLLHPSLRADAGGKVPVGYRPATASVEYPVGIRSYISRVLSNYCYPPTFAMLNTIFKVLWLIVYLPQKSCTSGIFFTMFKE